MVRSPDGNQIMVHSPDGGHIIVHSPDGDQIIVHSPDSGHIIVHSQDCDQIIVHLPDGGHIIVHPPDMIRSSCIHQMWSDHRVFTRWWSDQRAFCQPAQYCMAVRLKACMKVTKRGRTYSCAQFGTLFVFRQPVYANFKPSSDQPMSGQNIMPPLPIAERL